MGEKKFLGARLRTADFGSAGSRRLLRNGEIPGVVYGKDQPIHVIVNAREFAAKRSGFGESTLISLNVADEKSHDVFVKSYQEDLLKGVVQHIDFFEVTAGQAVRTNVRIACRKSCRHEEWRRPGAAYPRGRGGVPSFRSPGDDQRRYLSA